MVRAVGFLTKEELAEMPEFSFKQIKRMAGYLKPFLIPLIIMFAIEAASSSISLVPQIISKSIVDDALVGKNMKLLILLLCAALGFSIVNHFITNGSGLIKREINWKIKNKIEGQLFEKICNMDYEFFKNSKMAEIKQTMLYDVYDVTEVILTILPDIIGSIAMFITAFTVMGSIDYRLIIAGLAIFPLEILPRRIQRRLSFDKHEKARKHRVEGLNFVEETFSPNASLLMKLFVKEKETCEKYSQIQKENYELYKIDRNQGHFFKFVIMILAKINSLLVYLIAGVLMIIYGNDAITIGSISMCIALCAKLKSPINAVITSKAELMRGLAAFTRILEYLDRVNKIQPPVNGIKADVCNGDVKFKHVDFAYEDGIPLLKDVNFTVPAGKTYALVGPSGAGKSSIINLIPRLYDVTKGRITFGGVDVKDIDLEYLRSNIGIVSQESFMFNGTILENLHYAKPDASFDEIVQACKNANIHDFIMSTEKGYESEVGVNGLKLSGGEKQRLAIARVLLKDPKILILDEATSALDSINEAAIQEALERLLAGRTSIIIAHRLSTVLNANKILVLKDGQIAEQGTHKQLVKLNGIYRKLYDTQFKKILDSENEG